MKIAINKVHFPVTSLGPGRRLGLWTQGCSIHCPGCASQDTWSFRDERLVDVEVLVAACRQLTNDVLDGITISGGEPFDQGEALALLLRHLCEWRTLMGADFDILCYSGYTLTRLRARHAEVLSRLDLLIPEPYRQKLPGTLPWTGSGNQPLVALSRRGEERLRAMEDAHSSRARMQVEIDGDRVWFIGIPRGGDFETFERALAERGIRLGKLCVGL